MSNIVDFQRYYYTHTQSTRMELHKHVSTLLSTVSVLIWHQFGVNVLRPLAVELLDLLSPLRCL